MRVDALLRQAGERDDVRGGLRIHLLVVAAGLVVLGLAAAFVQIKGISGDNLSREPQVVLEGKLWVGALSNFGALVWMAGATFAGIGWMTSSDRAERHMFAFATLLGAALLVDDFFLFHDWLSYHSELLERGVVLGYLIGMVALLALFWRPLGPLATAGIIATMGFLAFSVALDELFNGLDQLYEDGAKFLGICTWATTWVLRARPWALRPGAGEMSTTSAAWVLPPEHVRGAG